MTSRSAIIALHDIQFSYDGPANAVLHNLSLEIRANTVTAILGPNGSGKTTLLHLIMSMLQPQAGTIMLDNRAQDAYSRRALSRLLGLVPQEESTPFDFSVLEYVLLGRAPHLGILETPGEKDYHVALEALDALGLLSLRERSVTSLSGGESQMATLARALTQKSRVLLLDEPTSHLDLGNRSHILHVMRALADNGVTVIFTTHDPNAASAVADDVILVREGTLLACGRMATVLNAENLTATYDVPVEVIAVHGRPLVV
ncbi:MAG: ABC transporter ATP-binding protein [Anaerolineae bacterium]|nr:ABC transporter ATP-binding protein [Anaerolineae bacterium]